MWIPMTIQKVTWAFAVLTGHRMRHKIVGKRPGQKTGVKSSAIYPRRTTLSQEKACYGTIIVQK